MKLTPYEWDMVVHALKSSAEVLEDIAAKLAHPAAQLANEYQRRAREMRALADRIEQARDFEK